MRIQFIQTMIDWLRGKKHYVTPKGFFSQYGEDAALNKLLNNKMNGFYIDIGANHPTEINNTYYFYLNKGWRGINIEPNPLLIAAFNKVRPLDINLNLGVADVSTEMTFYVLASNALSSFSEEIAKRNSQEYKYPIIDQIKVKTDTLKNIINYYAPNKHIDFMSVDVEGFEMQVLKGNDWNQYRPNFLVIECNINAAELHHYIDRIGYNLIYNNGTNRIYKDISERGEKS